MTKNGYVRLEELTAAAPWPDMLWDCQADGLCPAVWVARDFAWVRLADGRQVLMQIHTDKSREQWRKNFLANSTRRAQDNLCSLLRGPKHTERETFPAPQRDRL